MNLTTIGNTTNSNWKRVTTHSVAAAAGVALALSAVVALGHSAPASTPAVPAREASVPAVSRGAEVSQQYFYIVSNEAERGALVHEGAANVVVAGTAAAEALIGEGARELSALGIPATIIDMTAGPSAVSGPRRVSEADIAASVLSTELANYLAPKVQDADVLASALSGEMATYGISESQPTPRVVSEADIAASALSGEMSIYG